MDCSAPGFPVLHLLPEFAQTYVHWVGDAIQPSHPLSAPSPAFNLSQHQGLFQGQIEVEISGKSRWPSRGLPLQSSRYSTIPVSSLSLVFLLLISDTTPGCFSLAWAAIWLCSCQLGDFVQIHSPIKSMCLCSSTAERVGSTKHASLTVLLLLLLLSHFSRVWLCATP